MRGVLIDEHGGATPFTRRVFLCVGYAGESVSILEVNNDVNSILNGKEVTRENLGKFQGEFSFFNYRLKYINYEEDMYYGLLECVATAASEL